MALIGNNIDFAADLLKRGELVAIPTETVYGLAGNALNEEAILNIFKVKNRPSFDPLIVHSHNISSLEPLIKNVNKNLLDLFLSFAPGPLTMIVEKSNLVSDLISSGKPTVALRIPNHPLTLQLLKQLDFPLAAPSANPFTYVSPTSAQHVAEQLGDKIPYILDGGNCNVGLESTIITYNEDKIIVLRLGGTSLETLQEQSKLEVVLAEVGNNASVPGNFKKHYSPKIQMLEGMPNAMQADHVGAICFSNYSPYINKKNQIILSSSANLDEAAKNLFAALRLFDSRKDLNQVYIEYVPDIGIGRAMNDRINRALSKS